MKNLGTADTIAKLVQSLILIISYFTRLIHGHFALAMLILALLTLVTKKPPLLTFKRQFS